MPEQRAFRLVDVFAEGPYQGNQLAVFLDGSLYGEAEMQRLAREFNFSEISFVFPGERHGNVFKVRIFTPAEEVPFAGHPTLGTAYVIIRELLREPVSEVVLEVPAGRIPVTVAYDEQGRVERLTMRQLPPEFGPTLDRAAAAAVLSIPEEAGDGRFPVEEVSTGLPFLIVPLRRMADLSRARVDREQWSAVTGRFSAKGILAFAPGGRMDGTDLSVRVFVPDLGIAEDPATGSGNGCLAGYLVQHGYFGSRPLDLRVEQGYDLGRPSLLFLAAQRENGRTEISVGGRVVPVATGELLVEP